MAEGVYRPERKSVETPTDNQQRLADMAAIRANAAGDSEGPVAPRPESAGFQVSGNVPPELRAVMGNRPTAAAVAPRGPKTRKATTDEFENGEMFVRDDRLVKLIESIKQNSTLYEEITLPSLGRFYDGDNGPQDGKLHIRPMTGEEEQILATPRFVKKGQAINMIFNRCMQEKFDSAKLLTPDRTYLLIYLRGISYSPSYEVEVKCPLCDRKFATTIDLNDLWVDQCPDSFASASLTDVLPTTKIPFTYRLPNGEDEQRVQDYRDRRLKNFDTAGLPDDTLSYRTALMVESIGEIVDLHEKQILLKHLPVSDSNYLRNVVNTPPFGVDTKVEIACPGCLGDFEMELPLETAFFFPRAKKTTQNTTRA